MYELTEGMQNAWDMEESNKKKVHVEKLARFM